MTASTVQPDHSCDDADEGHVYRWEIEPHPYSTDYDTYVTDDDQQARQAAMDAAELLWDEMSPGDDVSVKIKFNGPSVADIPSSAARNKGDESSGNETTS